MRPVATSGGPDIHPRTSTGQACSSTSVAAGLRWAGPAPGLSVVEARPRYLPAGSRLLLAVPGLRELVTWNLWMVLRKT